MTDLERAETLYRSGGFTGGGTVRTGAANWFARNSGVAVSTVTRWGEDGWPGYARTILDLLELLPIEEWPEGWKAPTTEATARVVGAS